MLLLALFGACNTTAPRLEPPADSGGDSGSAAAASPAAQHGGAGPEGAAGAAGESSALGGDGGTNGSGATNGISDGGADSAAGSAGAPEALNAAPVISMVPDVVVDLSTFKGKVEFTVEDDHTPLDELVFGYDCEQISGAFAGQGKQRHFEFTLEQLVGATVIIHVGDGLLTATRSFQIVLNTPPSIAGVSRVGTLLGVPLQAFLLSISDDFSPPLAISVSASSSNTALLPHAAIEIDAASSPGELAVNLEFAPGVTGSSNVTLTATDERGEQANFTFEAVVVSEPLNEGAELISRSSEPQSVKGDAPSYGATLSADARYVAFVSMAKNLLATPEDTASQDIFVWDRQDESIQRVTNGDGVHILSVISADASTVAFVSSESLVADDDDDDQLDVYVRERVGGAYSLLSAFDSATGAVAVQPPAMTTDGQLVAFSSAMPLVAGDTNGTSDVFIHDRQSAAISRASTSSSGVQGNGDSDQVSLSGDGSVVAFASKSTNLIDGQTDPYPYSGVFVSRAGVTTKLAAGQHPIVSGDGSVVALESLGYAPYHRDVYVYVFESGSWELLTAGADDDSYVSSVSSDGRYVTFRSIATNLTDDIIGGGAHVYVYDREAWTTTLVGRSYVGLAVAAGPGALSGNGTVIAVDIGATSVVVADDDEDPDVYVFPRP